MQRDINVRFGDQLAFNRNNRILRCQRRGHQQCRQELAGDAAVNLDVTAVKTAAQTQWRIVFLLKILNLRAALTQSIHQVTNRTLFHARLAGQHNVVATQTQGCRQRAHRGTGVAQKQLKLFARAQRAAVAGHFAAGTIVGESVMNAQRFQRIEHMAHVIAVQQVCEDGGAVCQSCQQQSAVRDTF